MPIKKAIFKCEMRFLMAKGPLLLAFLIAKRPLNKQFFNSYWPLKKVQILERFPANQLK